jgi:hypothetical protein
VEEPPDTRPGVDVTIRDAARREVHTVAPHEPLRLRLDVDFGREHRFGLVLA